MGVTWKDDTVVRGRSLKSIKFTFKCPFLIQIETTKISRVGIPWRNTHTDSTIEDAFHKPLYLAQLLQKLAWVGNFLPMSDLEWPWMTWQFLSKMFPSMMCTLSRNCYMLQCTHTMLLLKRYQNQPLTLIIREPGVRLKRTLVSSIEHTELYHISENWQTIFSFPHNSQNEHVLSFCP